MKAEIHNWELRIFVILLMLVLAGTETLLFHNTLYTEGEIMQSIYGFLVFLNIPVLALAIWRPRIGMWFAVALGALLLPWQGYMNRKWALIHEEIIAVIRHIDARKESTGRYPSTLDDYTYRSPWVKAHVDYHTTEGSYKILYFMDNLGIHYWYSPQGGFGYYPD